MAINEQPQPSAVQSQWGPDFPPAPNLGRSARVVGRVVNVDMNQSPHPKNARGELGKALYNWYRNSISKDPLTRVSAPNHYADRRNFLVSVVNQASKGKINPRRVAVDDPAAMTRHIKAVARFMGADAVGIARAHPSFMYAGSRYVQDGTAEDSFQQSSPEELCRKFPYIIVATTAWDYNKLQAHRHHIGDAAYHVSQMKGHMILKALEGYVKELGYTALRGVANPQASGLAAGLGELGRNGLIINPKFGARVHMPDPIMTDLPLVPDKPIDIGVEDFCKICRKCANTCPTNSIPFGDKVVFNGVEKYKINWLTCYKLRPYVHDYWGSCLTCAAVCPFTKPNVWWHSLAVWALHTCPIPARPALVHALKWIDDRFWGVTRSSRVRWLGYDSGVKPGEHACTVAGCTAAHAGKGQSAPVAGNVGYYAPLKENTNRFVKRDA
ncbi:MAG TPA: reductive dehalogenase [Candidatus Acidoferrales bacterium]|nr:reductive dehalogenase [Candidatus Acidoferrales bacterium]